MPATTKRPRRRPPLTRERVLHAAVALADEQGLDALSMRRLGAALGVEAMSLYNHVEDKDDLLDGIVDVVTAEFELPDPSLGWREAMRRSAVTAHRVLVRHPWSAALAESRAEPGPQRLAYLEALLGTLRGAGFSVAAAYRVNLFLDSYIYGFTLQEVAWPSEAEDEFEPAAEFVQRTSEAAYPHLVDVAGLVAGAGWDPGGEFEIGLDLLLDGLERLRDDEANGT